MAADAELPVRNTAERLMSEGLDRHEAIHAIRPALAAHMHNLIHKPESGSAPTRGRIRTRRISLSWKP